MINQQEIKSGLHYFVMGWYLITRSGLRRFAIMPILLNIALMFGLFLLFIDQANGIIDWIMNFMPYWLGWINSLMFIAVLVFILVVFYFSFTMLSGFIAAPFNALLAEKVEKMLTGEVMVETNFMDFIKDLPRMLLREWQKLLYVAPRYILLFLLGFMPLIGQTIIPIVGFIFGAWMTAIQYCDYPFDNHKISFRTMKFKLGQNRTQNLIFGSLVTICTLIPIINLVVIPVAVCGATAMWVEAYRKELHSPQDIRQKSSLSIVKRSTAFHSMIEK